MPIRGHADIQCCSLYEGVLFSTGNVTIDGYNTVIIPEEPCDRYPGDCLLNSFRLGNSIICGRKPSKAIIELAEKNDFELIMTNQGYAKCSCAIIDKHTVITADRSIASALENTCDILLINEGGIELPGYSYGFIGGTCGKIRNDKLLFFGNPLRHPDGRAIVSFIEKHDCDIVSVKDGDLFDFGGFIPLFEE